MHQRRALMFRRLFWILVVMGSAPPARADEFTNHVLPLLTEHCFACHSTSGKSKGGLILDTPAGLKKGGESGAAIVASKPDDSRLIQAVRYTHADLQMPPKGKLPANAIKKLEDWVRAGAIDPRPLSQTETWWSFKPLAAPAVPASENPIDSFIRAKLRAKGLKPAPSADPRTLIRRLTFDLTGLPPTPEEIDAFCQSAIRNRQSAIEDAVNRLLASPRYGERWGRHWLDVVHYGDTHGYDKDKPRPNAWPYRDYVIRSLNEDKRYDQFVQEQLAGDVLNPGSRDGIEALGFIAAGPWDFIGHEELPESKIDGKHARHQDRDDMVANTISTFVSLTAHCAQCHDHKFDPIPQEDYYALQAVFAALDRGDREYYRDAVLHQKVASLREARDKLLGELRLYEAEIRKKAGPALIQVEQALSEGLRARNENRAPEFGYHSALAKAAETKKWVQIDLGGSVALDRVELLPCYDDFAGIGAGFGFPTRFKIELCDDPAFRENVRLLIDRTTADVPNPGVDALSFPTHGKAGRYLRVTATKLASRKDVFIFALDEVRALDVEGDNHARGKAVTALDAIEVLPRWRKANLVDGQAFGREHGLTIGDLTKRRAELIRTVTGDGWRSMMKLLDQQIAHLDALLQEQIAPDRVYAGTVHHGDGNFIGTGSTGGKPRPIHVLKRGDVKTPLHEAKPGALTAIGVGPPRFDLPADHGEGARRAALARWITAKDNPLTWRSIVNRVWQYHFGRGLCATPGDFGRMGEVPTHPELLDYLAANFRDGNQSLKQLHRLIVTSETYQQAVVDDPAASAMDADNKWLWRMNRRRLDAEEVHDSLLFVSGKLNLKMGGPGFQDFVVEKPEHSPHYLYHRHDPEDARAHRRGVYRFVVRSKAQPFLAALDCADPSLRVDKRNETLTPQQALAMWNDRLAVALAGHFAARGGRETKTDEERVTAMYRLALGRGPTDAERTAVLKHARQHGWPSAARLLFNLNEFLFVD